MCGFDPLERGVYGNGKNSIMEVNSGNTIMSICSDCFKATFITSLYAAKRVLIFPVRRILIDNRIR